MKYKIKITKNDVTMLSFYFFRNIRENSVELLRPVILTILCSDKVYCEFRDVWKSVQFNDEIVCEILLKCRNSPAVMNSLILDLFDTSKPKIDLLLLLIVSTKTLLEASHDPTDSFEVILHHCDEIVKEINATNMLLFLIAELLQITSISHIPKLLEIIENLVVKNQLGHKVIRNMLLDGLIQILAFPSFAKGKLSAVERIVTHIQKQKVELAVNTSRYHSIYLQSSPDLLNARDVSIMLETNQVNLNTSTFADQYFWSRNQIVLRGLMHSDYFPQFPFDFLIQITKTNDVMKSSLVMPLLFKLTSTSNPRMKLAILQNMIQLGTTAEVFSTIKALSTSLIRSMSIDLHLRMWKLEPRTYPFLHKVLVEKSAKDSTDHRLEIVVASAIRDICDLRPQHGSDLISTISEILNKSGGEIETALAIDSIVLLCQNHVINVGSTWKAIGLKTRYEKRPTVIKSLCKFFAIIPSMKRSNLEYENLMKEILGRLWYIIQWSDEESAKYAFNAMKSWNYELMTLDTIPEIFREGIPLPAAPENMEVSILDLEVPGECFVQLLVKIPAASDLIAHYIGNEINEFRSGHYLVKEGQPEPMNYKNLPKQSIIKALVQLVIYQSTTKKAEKLVSEKVLVSALNVLGRRFSRPLPPLNWCFLFDLMHKSEDIKVECLTIAAKQSIISGTAQRLIENFLVNLDGHELDDVNTALNVLPFLCDGISTEVFRTSINFIFSQSSIHPCVFEEKVGELLRHETHVTNRENLATVISVYASVLQLSSKVIHLIPPKILDTISPQLSPLQKLEFRCEIIKTNKNVENPIAWVNEMIATPTINFLPNFTALLITSDIFPKKAFIIDFMIMIQNHSVEDDFPAEKFKFFLDIFMVSVISASGYFKVLLCNENIYENRCKIFPQSFELVSQQSNYEDIIGRMIEFLIHVFDNEVVDVQIRECFKSAILLTKNHSYFKKEKVWTKCLMMK